MTSALARVAAHPVRSLAMVLAAAVPAALYVAYVAHFSVDVAYYDDWSIVPMIDAARHGTLTWHALWVQHNESRNLVGNVILVGFGLVDRYDTRTITLANAVLFVAAYAGVVALWRRSSGRAPHPLALLVVGCAWFSLADFESALMAFQLMWVLVIVLLVADLLVLSRRRLSLPVVAVAAAVAVAASYSAFQGLLLWPLGLAVLAWRRASLTRPALSGGLWVLAAVVTVAVYLHGFSFSSAATGGGSVSAALGRPLGLIRYFLVLLGNVFPSENPRWVHLHELAGVVLLGSALAAAAWSLARSRSVAGHPAPAGDPSPAGERSLPLGAALVAFGLAFDVWIALGRASLGVESAQASSRYTMPNVLLVVAVTMAACDVLRRRRPTERRGVAAAGPRLGVASVTLASVALASVAVQVAVSANFGLTYGRTSEQNAVIDARTVVNLDRMGTEPAQFLVPLFVINSLEALRPLRQTAWRDRLNVFAPGVAAVYRREGPPLDVVPPALRE